MKMYLTKGMFGSHLEQIGDESNSVKSILENLAFWKQNLDNQKKYKIEKYDRLIFEKNRIAIDFGDYSTFMIIEDISEEQKKKFTSI